MTNAGTLLDQTNSAERRAGELAAEVERLKGMVQREVSLHNASIETLSARAAAAETKLAHLASTDTVAAVLAWIERGTKAERERDALREKSEKMAKMLRFAETYDLIGIVGHLVALGEHVAEAHDCDAHGWEVRERAVRDAKAWLAEVDRAALAGKR